MYNRRKDIRIHDKGGRALTRALRGERAEMFVDGRLASEEQKPRVVLAPQ